MRAPLKLVTGIGVLAGAILYSAAVSAEPYFHRYMDGSWTNAEYSDGLCHYYYSHNSYDGQTHLNRYGDCSHIAIGPGGEAIPLPPAPIAMAPY